MVKRSIAPRKMETHACKLPLVILNVLLPSQTGHEKLTWRDRLPGYLINISSILFMVSLILPVWCNVFVLIHI